MRDCENPVTARSVVGHGIRFKFPNVITQTGLVAMSENKGFEVKK